MIGPAEDPASLDQDDQGEPRAAVVDGATQDGLGPLRLKLGVAGLGVLGLLLLLFARRPALAPDLALDVETPELDLPTHVVAADPHAHATALRAEAYRDCLAFGWQRCLDGLDIARELDPAGEADPRVTAARTDAIDGLAHDEDKPGSGWGPKNRGVYGGAARR